MKEQGMKSYKLPAKMLKAAQLFEAKNDIRYYLNGVHLDKEGSRICGTNGHMLIACKDGGVKDLPQSMIIKVQGAVPASAETAYLTPIDDQKGFLSFFKASGAPVNKLGAQHRLFYDVIEGKYPDVDKVLPGKKTESVSSIGINAEYMGEIAKAAKSLGIGVPQVRLSFEGEQKVIGVTLMGESDVQIALMPCRV